MKRFSPLLVALILSAFADAAVAQPGVPDFLVDLNQAALGAYQQGRKTLFELTSPIIVVAGDELVLRRGGAETRERFTPPVYHQLKSIAHLALGIHGAVRPSMGQPVDQALRDRLASLRSKASVAAGRLGEIGLTPALRERQRRFFETSLRFLDRVSATDAARAQLDGLHGLVQRWRSQMTPEDWQRLYVVVLGPKTPRAGNLQFEYFAYALGRDTIDKRLIYAEGIFDVAGGLRLLATLIADRAAGRDLFADEGRLERDLLADGAQAHLLKLFGKTGSD